MNVLPLPPPGTAIVWQISLQPPFALLPESRMPELPAAAEADPANADPANACLARRVLNEQEFANATRFVTSPLRSRYAAAHVAMRVILSKYLQIAPADVPIAIETWGRPVLDVDALPIGDFGGVGCDIGDRASELQQRVIALHFNLSHSDSLGMLAISNGHCIGMDVERVRTIKANQGVSKTVFTPIECERLVDAQPELWFRYWTAKEAVMKAVGKGFYLNPKKIDLDADARHAIAHDDPDDLSFHLYPCPAPARWIATIASPQPLHGIEQHHFDWTQFSG